MKLAYKIVENFDMEKNYKLFRMFQKILNPTWNKKDKFVDIDVELKNRNIVLRVFNSNINSKKIIIFFHGGGWVSGSIESYTNIAYKLACETKSIVILPDYRLAPENPYPAGFNDCYSVTKLIFENASNLNIDPRNIILMGDSAGGNLAAAVAQKFLDNGLYRIKKQILLYPALQTDYSNNTKFRSVIENGRGFMLTQDQLNDFLNHYIKDKKDLDNPYVGPLYAKHLFGLPKTLLILCGNDPLLDEGIAYAKKLRRHLVRSKYYIFDNVDHGFFTNVLNKKNVDDTFKIIKKFMGGVDE